MSLDTPTGAIPIANLWFLLVYASGLARFGTKFDAEIDGAADLPELFGRLLKYAVEKRLKRNLTRAYVPQQAVLTRVRGRIDILRTMAGEELKRGRVACRFEEPTTDTPRNRLVRAALAHIAGQMSDAALAHDCRSLAQALVRLGVSVSIPSRSELARDKIGRNDAEDLLMVIVAQLALDPRLPTEAAGRSRLTVLERDEGLLQKIFERAVAGFYEYEARHDWAVKYHKQHRWPAKDPTSGALALLPIMETDIILSNRSDGRKIVIDTKFTHILRPRQHGGFGFKSDYLYQMYSYLRSQSDPGGTLSDSAEGMLLHPAIDRHVDEAITLHKHRIRFATLDLAASPTCIRHQLLGLLAPF